MKRVIFTVAATIVALFVFVGCNISSSGSVRGTGPMVLHPINASNFTGINISGGYDITWINSPNFNVTLEIQENLFGYVETSVSNGVFSLSSSRGFNTSGGNTPRLRIYAPFIDNIVLSGAADITGWDTLDQNSLSINISGAADIELEGRVENLHINVSGASNVSLFDLVATHAVIDVSGASDVDIHATETLNITLSGVGNVRYDGNPTITRNVSGLGVIRAR
ncbi:MAG: DUF2807 domain-containing protein [Defluviitaleaceae bacterium]|nr:DUF2807 domain-containing protein [Defluviitaleaceae bacterium]